MTEPVITSAALESPAVIVARDDPANAPALLNCISVGEPAAAFTTPVKFVPSP